ncbi:MAG: hypothetical protein HUJ65_01935 [Oscillospiraceae bacterium]|nr:hypothetical protein [Oscillospiraceae bacterium]
MKSKLTVCILCFSMLLLLLAGCGAQKDTQENSAPEIKPTEEQEITEPDKTPEEPPEPDEIPPAHGDEPTPGNPGDSEIAPYNAPEMLDTYPQPALDGIEILPVFADRYPTGQLGLETEATAEMKTAQLERVRGFAEALGLWGEEDTFTAVSASASGDIDRNSIYLVSGGGYEFISHPARTAVSIPIENNDEMAAIRNATETALPALLPSTRIIKAACEYAGIDLSLARVLPCVIDIGWREFIIYEGSDNYAEDILNRGTNYITVTDYGLDAVTISVTCFDTSEKLTDAEIISYEDAIVRLNENAGYDLGESVVFWELGYSNKTEHGKLAPYYAFYYTNDGYISFEILSAIK